MINISKIVESWEEKGGWRISPGVEWCEKGNKICIGSGVLIGSNVRIGSGVLIGSNVRIGSGVRIGSDVRIWHGHVVKEGKPICTLGFADGYQKSLNNVDGIAYIGAGCRWFTLEKAFEHWSNHKEDRRHTLCLLESAKFLAELHNLKWS